MNHTLEIGKAGRIMRLRRKKHHQSRRLSRLKYQLEEHQTPAELPPQPDRPRTEAERQNMVEQRIQEAMAEGLFDNLPGKGKPLPLNSNPYLEPGQELAFGLLKNNGFAPEWIERDKEIRRELAAARKRLRLAWQQGADKPAWPRAVARFEAELAKLNRKIDDFNLIVPIVWRQRSRVRLEDEIRRAQQGAK